MSDADFYLTLPSNVDSLPDNTSNSYTTRLPKTVDLPGEWEVGLSEIHWPYSWNNLPYGVFHISMFDDGRKITIPVEIPRSYYADMRELSQIINEKIENSFLVIYWAIHEQSPLINHKQDIAIPLWYMKQKIDEIPIEIRRIYKEDHAEGNVILGFSDTLENRMSIYLNHKVDRISLYPGLQYIMGYAGGDSSTLRMTENTAKYPPDLSGGIMAMYVYCDIIMPQIVGDSMQPLLHVIPLITNNYKYGSTMQAIYENPHYIPIKIKELHTISINLYNDQAIPIDFNFGKSLVKLHFRRKT